METVSYQGYQLYLPQDVNAQGSGLIEQLWFVMKQLHREGREESLQTWRQWAKLWWLQRHKQCEYEPSIMEKIKELEKWLF